MERSTSVVTESPALNSSVIETAEAKEIAQKSKGSVEESKRDVGREEILADNGNKREKRKNKDKKSVGEERNDKANIRPRKTPVHSRETGKESSFSCEGVLCPNFYPAANMSSLT